MTEETLNIYQRVAKLEDAVWRPDPIAVAAFKVEVERLEAELHAWRGEAKQLQWVRAENERLRAELQAWKAKALAPQGSDANSEVVTPMQFGAVPDATPSATREWWRDTALRIANDRDKESEEVTRLSDMLREMQAERDLLRERLLRMESAQWNASVKAEQLMRDLRPRDEWSGGHKDSPLNRGQ